MKIKFQNEEFEIPDEKEEEVNQILIKFDVMDKEGRTITELSAEGYVLYVGNLVISMASTYIIKQIIREFKKLIK